MAMKNKMLQNLVTSAANVDDSRIVVDLFHRKENTVFGDWA